MTGLMLVILLVLTTWILLRRPTAYLYPALLLGLAFSLLGLFAPPLWNATSQIGDTGLPFSGSFTPAQVADTRAMFLVATIGVLTPGLAGALGRSIALQGGDTPEQSRSLVSDSHRISVGQSHFLLVTSTAILAAWIIGQGAAAFRSFDYLAGSGPIAVQRLANPLSPLAILASGVVLASTFRDRRRTALAAMTLLLAWWAFLASKGTRLSMLVPLTIGVALIAVSRPILLKLCILGITCSLALITLQVAILARSRPHGLTNLPSLLADPSVPWPMGVGDYATPLSFLGKNVSGVALVSIESVARAPSGADLMRNLNPLPAPLARPLPFTEERFWPYEWVPLSTIGELQGAYGYAGVLLTCAAFSIALTIGASGWGRSPWQTRVALLSLSLTPLACVFLVQYSTRNSFRILWLSFVLAVLQIALASRSKAPHSIPQLEDDRT